MSLEALLSKIEDSRNELAEVCSKLVQCPSDHPEGRTVECVRYIESYFQECGVTTDVFARDKNKPNIVARIKGSSPRKIIYLGHLDVVPVGETGNWKYPPFSGKIADGLIWGRGASDMKGSCASAMVAAKYLSVVNPPFSFDFWFTADEEIGAIEGAKWLSEEKMFEGEIAIVGDGTGCTPGFVNVCLGNKGNLGTSLVAKGKTAHSSTPYLGDNAIDKLLKVIPFVKQVGDFPLELPEELLPILESSTKLMLLDDTLDLDQIKAVKKLFYYPTGPSLNIFKGGIKSNVVPDEAFCQFDIRLTPGSDSLKIKEKIEELIAKSGVSGITASVKDSQKVGYYESPDTRAVHSLIKTVETVTGEKPVLTIAPWRTDAERLKSQFESTDNPDGIPALIFGPMHRDQLHQPNEYVSIENLIRACKVYASYPYFYV